ncbi:MAG: type II secretion system protein E [Candidatus Syntrophoarchaeum caldarius]|uniref:Type II secretion system protein E n=1 Tax=Candidatus Syntropharchaeum caldarium TaxID=1838285 RepID=A0A1F2P7G9_9EURY|nr:MAG: type II secretion system protein E [Candidatus Syntrophoarchaeum caldarius]
MDILAQIIRGKSEEENNSPSDIETLDLLHYDVPEGYIEVERTWLKKPYALASILFNEAENEYYYHLAEPKLTPFEKALLEKTYDDLRDVLVLEGEVAPDEKEKVLEHHAKELLNGYSIEINPESLEKILYYLKRNCIGIGKIDALMEDEFIEDISCDGVNVPIFLYHKRYQNIKTNLSFAEDELDSFVIVLAQKCGKHLSIAEPMLDATMQDGSRLQITLGRDITTRGSSFTIRRFASHPFTPVDLLRYQTFTKEMLAYLWLCIESNRSLLFAGGTAAGKTSALNAVSIFIPPNAKIISIEDTRELTLYHDNWIADVTRESTLSGGARKIDMYELLRHALRQRPEYLLVGEVRGREAHTLFQAMSTGHTTYSTIHASTIEEVVNRLRNEPISVPLMMLQALDILSIQRLLYIEKGERVRRCDVIAEFAGIDPATNNIKINELYRFNSATNSFEKVSDSIVLAKIQNQRGWSTAELEEDLNRRAKLLDYMLKKDMWDYKEISMLIHRYFYNPEMIMGMIEEEIGDEEDEPDR